MFAVIRALDGSEIAVDGFPRETTGWGFRAWYTSRRSGVSVIMSTQAGVCESSPLPDATIVSEARSGSARLLALADRGNESHPTTTFVYQTAHHELYTTQVGVDIPMDLFVDFLRPLDITDTPEGIRAVPRARADATVELHVGGTMVPDVAIVTSYFTAQALKEVPSHRGQSAFGGELWKAEGGEGMPDGVLLANSTAATVLGPVKDRDDPKFVALAQSMRVARKRA